ncbi:putative sulfate exporter family transporter [Dyella sp. ASV21]|uniref:YeiH family protein n=1 Tax=Dyella sp. ASV21 TaxID=2795114 RepID=UPI0018ED021B|nr:putative sulfate exporter family transporter [Dyella sp. ASV21]
MSEVSHAWPRRGQPEQAAEPPRARLAWLANEDWWSVWIGLLVIAVAWALFANGSSLKWLAVAPAKWKTLAEAAQGLAGHWPNYLALFATFALLFGSALAVLGQSLTRFVPSFLILFGLSLMIFTVSAWTQASRYNLEAPLLALALGLLLSNTVGVPEWLQGGLRVEFYIKTGIVLLGATLPLTLLVWAGPVAAGQATIVSLVTFFTIFLTGKALGLDRRFAAVLGLGGAVCGVSAAIATGGAVRAKREQTSMAITLVVVWAIAMIFVLPFASRALGLSTAVAGAWIGTSEFADAAGVAAAQAYGDAARNAGGAIAGAPDAAVQAFTLMKVVGRDIWIGIWAFVLAWVATTRWNTETDGVQAKADIREIWARFPKFVFGFVLASALVTWVAGHYSLADYRKVVTPDLVAPISTLRTWVFTFCFLSIGLTTRLRSLATTGWRPLLAFTVGVVVNIVIGYVLSVHVFADFWNGLGG